MRSLLTKLLWRFVEFHTKRVIVNYEYKIRELEDMVANEVDRYLLIRQQLEGLREYTHALEQRLYELTKAGRN